MLFEIFNSEKDRVYEQIGGTQKGRNKKEAREKEQKFRAAQKRIKEKLLATGKFEVVDISDRYFLKANSKPMTLKAFNFDLSYMKGDSSKASDRITAKDYENDRKLAGQMYMKKLNLCVKQVSDLVQRV